MAGDLSRTFGFGFSVTPLIAVDGDRLDINIGLQDLAGDPLPAGTSVRLIITTSGDVGGILSRSVLANVEEGYFESNIISSGENGGTISARITHAFIGDEDEPRNIVGRNSANIRVLPQAQARSAPEPSDMIQVLPARTTIYDGQTAQFFITGRGQHIRGLDYSIGFDSPGITEIGDGCGGNTPGALWLGLPQTNFCTDQVGGEINPGGENAESAVSRSFRTGHNGNNISSNGSVTYSILNAGGDTATINVIARNESLVAEGNTSNDSDNEGWQMFTRDDNPEPFDPDDENFVYQDISTINPDDRVQRITTLIGNNSGVDTVSIDEGITLVDDGSDPIPETAVVDTMGGSSEFEVVAEGDVMEPTITGQGSRTKSGPGISRASSGNTYSGATNVEEGTLEIPQGGQGQSTEFNLSEGTRIIYNNAPAKVIIPDETVTTMTNNITIQNDNGVTDYRGTIVGGTSTVLNITSANNGGIIFRQPHPDFEGETIVHRGAELFLDNEGDVHNGNITVYGALKGKGTINGNVTIKSGGYFLVGAEVGTETHINGNLILESGSNTYISLLENGNDRLRVTGNITIENNTDLFLVPFQVATMANAYNLVMYTGTLNGEFTNIINYKDSDSENGYDELPDSEYPDDLDYTTNGIITGNK